MSTPDTPPLLESFHLFPKLVPEIRHEIWKHAVSNVGGRKVVAHLDRKHDHGLLRRTIGENGQVVIHGPYDLISRQDLPGVLHACGESRGIALNRWKLMFSYRGLPPKILFDAETDIFIMGETVSTFCTYLGLSLEETGRLKRVGVHLECQIQQETVDPWYGDGELNLAYYISSQFPSLEELIFTTGGLGTLYDGEEDDLNNECNELDSDDEDSDDEYKDPTIRAFIRTYEKERLQLPIITVIPMVKYWGSEESGGDEDSNNNYSKDV